MLTKLFSLLLTLPGQRLSRNPYLVFMTRAALHKKLRSYLVDSLAGESKLLFATVASRVDDFACTLGRKTEVFPHLDDYERLLPDNWCARWVGNDAGGGIMYAMLRTHPDAASKWAPIAGPFDAAVDMGPIIPPRLPVAP